MVQLKQVEDTAERLVFRVGSLQLIGHMGLLTFIALTVTAALTLFTIRWIGLFLTCAFVTLPGVLCAACGIWGAFNARSFTFTFNHASQEFKAVAGTSELTVPLSRIVLVYIERELDSGGGVFLLRSAPTYSLTLLLEDGQRCHLEGGMTATGTERGPPELHQYGIKIQEFLQFPQNRVAILELTRDANPVSSESSEEGQKRLSRWLSCAGIAPRLEPPLYEYPWLEAPEGAVLPRPPPRTLSQMGAHGPGYGQGLFSHSVRGHIQASGGLQDRWASSVGVPVANGPVVMGRAPATGHAGPAPVVMGRVPGQLQARFLQVVVPEGMPGQNMTVMTPDGTQLAITVPRDAIVGQPITLQY